MSESRGRDVEVWKKLTANDLGHTGSHQAGIHVPKQPEILRFFPMLDEESYNPECEIAVRLEPGGRCLAVRYIHYNGKLTRDGTRNEYRLTRTAKIFRTVTALPGDLLRFRWLPSGEMEISLHHDDASRGGPPRPCADDSSPKSATGSSREIGSSNDWTVIQVVLPLRTERE